MKGLHGWFTVDTQQVRCHLETIQQLGTSRHVILLRLITDSHIFSDEILTEYCISPIVQIILFAAKLWATLIPKTLMRLSRVCPKSFGISKPIHPTKAMQFLGIVAPNNGQDCVQKTYLSETKFLDAFTPFSRKGFDRSNERWLIRYIVYLQMATPKRNGILSED